MLVTCAWDLLYKLLSIKIMFSIVFAVGYPYLVHIWQKSRFKQTIIQIYTCMYAFGGVLSPFVINLFLAPLNGNYSKTACYWKNTSLNLNSSNSSGWFRLPDEQENPVPSNWNSINTSHIGLNVTSKADEMTVSSFMVTNSLSFPNNDQTTSNLELSRWAFTIGTSVSLLSALLLSIGILPSFSVRLGEKFDNSSRKSSIFATTVKYRLLFILILSSSTLLIILKTFTSSILTQYLQTFAIVGLQWTTDQSSYLNGILGAGQLVGCVVTILMSKINSQRPVIALGVALGIWTTGVVLMLLAGLGLLMSAGMMCGVSMAGKSIFGYNR